MATPIAKNMKSTIKSKEAPFLLIVINLNPPPITAKYIADNFAIFWLSLMMYVFSRYFAEYMTPSQRLKIQTTDIPTDNATALFTPIINATGIPTINAMTNGIAKPDVSQCVAAIRTNKNGHPTCKNNNWYP